MANVPVPQACLSGQCSTATARRPHTSRRPRRSPGKLNGTVASYLAGSAVLCCADGLTCRIRPMPPPHGGIGHVHACGSVDMLSSCRLQEAMAANMVDVAQRMRGIKLQLDQVCGWVCMLAWSSHVDPPGLICRLFCKAASSHHAGSLLDRPQPGHSGYGVGLKSCMCLLTWSSTRCRGHAHPGAAAGGAV